MKKFVLCCFAVASLLVAPVGAITEKQSNAIHDRCTAIKDSLKLLQKQDARTRVYLGGYYERILSQYIIPLNVRLVENNMADVKLTENQNNFAVAKKAFNDDYIKYQQALEELISIDCKTEMNVFYDKLVKVRTKRKTVNQDVVQMKELMVKHKTLVEGLTAKL